MLSLMLGRFTCAGMLYGVCSWRDGDLLFLLDGMRISRITSPGWRYERSECHIQGFLMTRSFLREVDFCVELERFTGPEPAGDRASL